jgi:hypothetical protein
MECGRGNEGRADQMHESEAHCIYTVSVHNFTSESTTDVTKFGLHACVSDVSHQLDLMDRQIAHHLNYLLFWPSD